MLQALFDERAKVHEQQKGINDLCLSEKRDFTAEEQEKDAQLEADYLRLSDAIKKVERDQKREAEEVRLAAAKAPAPDSEPDDPEPGPGPGDDEDDAAEQRKKKIEEQRKKTYEREFVKYVRTGEASPELRASTDPQTVGTNADGGYTVADEWMKRLQIALEEENVMRQLAEVITTKSGTLNIPINSAHGAAAWYTEGQTIVVAKETFDNVQLTPIKGARIVTISEELLNDSLFNMSQFLINELSRSLGNLQETGFVAGSGSGEPSGIAHASVGAATGVTAASATAFTIDELMELYHSVATPYRKNGAWLLNDTSALIMRKLKDGNGRYLWQDSVQLGQPDRFLGKQVVTAEDMPAATTTNNAVLFGDFKRAYIIADRVGIRMKRLGELYQVNDLIGFKATARTDGKIREAAAVRALTMA